MFPLYGEMTGRNQFANRCEKCQNCVGIYGRLIGGSTSRTHQAGIPVRSAISARGLTAALLDVTKTLPEQGHHVPVVERVEDHSPVAPRADNTRAAEQAELVRHGGFAHAQPVRFH